MMRMMAHSLTAAIVMGSVVLVGVNGCGQADRTGPVNKPIAGAKHQVHGEWWCDEHGIPEEICSMCSASYARQCQAKGDWCDEHNRAKSQCFICEPNLKEKFAVMYRDKYGKEPPPIRE
ncbi:MAG: RND transporter [Gemmataceae bacterium]